MADKWVILPQGQRATTELQPGGGGFRTVWEITFEVTQGPAAGTIASVKVPAALHNVEGVKAAIDAKVADLDAVAGL